ncbi:MAG: winged helix-turn-helix transcriptional regulator [Prevotella sp.]|nr:winged helix-turn-helix transcriptional regulator [Prevotella sp.]
MVNHTNIATETSTVTTETSAKTTETTTETLSDTAETPTKTTETIIDSIRNNPKITTKEIAAVCRITEDCVSYHIKKLKQMGKIVRVGGSRNRGEWKVVE